MSISAGIMYVMAFVALVGGLDKLLGNRLGLGEKFEEGFSALGPLTLSMSGIVCLAPVLARYLGPVVIPGLTGIGADPAIFGSIFANDMGGFPLAMELAIDQEAGLFSGLIVAAFLGCTIVFSIPVGLGLIEKRDQPYFAKGLLIGLTTIPVGSILGGYLAGYAMDMVLVNSVPVIAISVLLAVGLKYIPAAMVKGCIVFGKVIVTIVALGLAIATFQAISGWTIIAGMTSLPEAMAIVCSICIVLAGTFPVLAILTHVLNAPLTAIGARLGINATATAGLIFTLANTIPVFRMMKDMNSRGKIVNAAWLVPATSALGDHLGFTAGVWPEAVGAVVISKLLAGLLAVFLAMLLTRSTAAEDRQSGEIVEAEQAAHRIHEQPATA